MSRRLRALHIAPIMPARSGNGLAMRQGMFLEALARRFETHLVVLPVAGPADDAPTLPGELGIPVVVVPVAGRQDTRYTLLRRLADPATRLTAFAAYGRSSLAASLSVAVLDDVRTTVGGEAFDLVHIGRSYLADALPAVGRFRTATLDLDEDEWTSYREMAAQLLPGRPDAAAWAEAEAVALSDLIGRSAARFARHFTAGAPDAARIGARHPHLAPEVIENAVALPAAIRREDDGATLLFLGAFGYPPNVDAVTWFADAVWPAIRARAPHPPRFLIVGRDADRVRDLDMRPGIEVRGAIDDVADAYAVASLCIAPLRAGAGTRLKLIEAAAHGVPMVATGLAARGLALRPGHDLLVADTPAAFADAVLATLADPAAARRRATTALALVRARHDRRQSIAHLACRLDEIAAK